MKITKNLILPCLCLISGLSANNINIQKNINNLPDTKIFINQNFDGYFHKNISGNITTEELAYLGNSKKYGSNILASKPDKNTLNYNETQVLEMLFQE